jgi:iron-sulfur cluster assembly protein
MSTKPKTDEKSNTVNESAEPVGTGLQVRSRARPASPGDGVQLTEKAAQQIKTILTKENYPDTMYLYVGVKGGGCSGLQYVLDLRDEQHAPVSETDEVFESQGIVIVCDLKSYVAGNLTGTTIDYHDGLMGAGFTFNNPNAKHTCGCGSSYSA